MSVEQEAEKFIGRDQEITFFQQWLNNEGAPSILYIYDALKEKEKKGGIGKTSLLRRFFELVEQHYPTIIPVFIDFFNVADRDGVVVAERIVQAVKEKHPDWNFSAFGDAFRVLRQAEANLDKHSLLNALAEDFHQLEPQMSATNTSVLIFFDTFELVEHNPVTAVLHPSQLFPDFYRATKMRAVIAGRNELDWTHPNWIGREREVEVHPLYPFSFEESLQYLIHRIFAYTMDDLEPEILHALYERCEGRPILLGLVSDVLNQRVKTPEALVTTGKLIFEASLVAEINNFETPQRWAIFSMAHIYHRFDTTLLHLLMNRPVLKEQVSEIEYQALAVTLPTLSFVRRSISSGDFVLHDEMCRLVNEHCWQPQDLDGRIRLELSELAVGYYNGLLEKEKHIEVKQSYMVEMLFHKLFLDIADGFRYFSTCFYEAIELKQMSFARSLFQELQKFAHQLSYEQSQAMAMAEARLLRGEFRAAAALKIYQELEQDAGWFEQHRVDLLYEKISCYIQLSQLTEALTCIRACLEVEETSKDKTRYASLLSTQGFIYRRWGQFNEAMRSYEESLRVQRNLDNPQDYASLLNNMANILRFQNRLEEALRHCKLSLRIRRDLYKQGKISEYDVGMSYSMLGHIYHELEDRGEEQAYQEAFDIYSRVGDRHGIASAYSCLGRVYAGRGEREKALEYFRQAERIAVGVSREAEIESLNQQGRVFIWWEQWQNAAQCFERALELSRDIGQKFQIAENLLYLADALDRFGLPSMHHVQEAKRIARKNDYKILLGKAGEVQGDMYYRKQDYRGAFKYYRVACHYLALRGSPGFDRFLRRQVNDRLIEMPGNFLPGAIDALLQYWYDMGLDKEYPELLDVCREVSKHMIL